MKREQKPSRAMIESRLPVWMAFSEFFLDTELQSQDYDRIAAVFRQSELSQGVLEEILRFEVYPAFHRNLDVIAGEWGGFDEGVVRAEVARFYDIRPKIRFPLLKWWMIREHWAAVRLRLDS